MHSIYDEILGIINKANEYVYIVSWHFKALNLLPEFTEAIKQAVDRGYGSICIQILNNPITPVKSLSDRLNTWTP